MTVSLAAWSFVVGAASIAPADPTRPRALTLLAPFDAEEIVRLERCCADHAAEWGILATVVRIVSPDVRDLAAETLLIGYESSLLESLARAGGLAVGEAGPREFASETWVPAWRPDEQGGSPVVTTFFGLVEAGHRGRVVARRITATGTDGLVLGAISAALHWSEESELRELLLADAEAGTLRSDSASSSQLLRDLPPGFATLVPRRAVAAARAAGIELESAPWQEGTPTLRLAAALTAASSAATRRWFVDRFERDLAPAVLAALQLEPLGASGDASSPGVAPLAFDRAAALAARAVLARLQEVPAAAAPQGAVELALRWIDEVLLTAAVVAIWIVALRFGRNRRDPRGGGVV